MSRKLRAVNLLIGLLLIGTLSVPLGGSSPRVANADWQETRFDGPLAVPPSILRQSALVLVNSQSAGYLDFQHFIQPYLDNFGVPYVTLDIATANVTVTVNEYALLIVGHRQLDPAGQYLDATEQANIAAAVTGGTGLANFDNDLSASGTARYQFVQDIFGFTYTPPGTATGVEFGAAPPAMSYITSNHQAGEVVDTGSMTMAGVVLPSNVSALASTVTGGQPFLAATTHGAGRAVQWGTYDWMSYSVKGPMYGLDDLVWRSLVWAARKPFVMQSLPPFVTMRVDDTDGPLTWLQIAVQSGFKPWVGIFPNSMSDADAAGLSGLVQAGSATAAIHAFSTDQFLYFDHAAGGNLPDATVASNFASGTAWLSAHNIPSSKYLVGHYYELGSNVFGGLDTWGVQFVGTHMAPGSPESGSPWLQIGPYRRYQAGLARALDVPVAYADFIDIPGHPEYANRFFDCVTEIRDEQGYEWVPSNDVAGSVSHGTRQLARALDGLVLPTLFAHEYNFDITAANWQSIMQGIQSNLAAYQPQYVTMDEACQYARAIHTSSITSSTYDSTSGQMTTVLGGATDMPTKIYFFTETDGAIKRSAVNVPAFSGTTQVTYPLHGSLDHVLVTPANASVAVGGSQQFTAQGYDTYDNVIPNLSFTWSVAAGGGSINAAGLFTAGIVPGTYAHTVVAATGGVQGAATVTVTPPPPNEGPGGPILVVASGANRFSRYYAEILRTEGLNAFSVTDITLVTAAVLANYDVVILGEMALTSAQVTMFSAWVTGGGQLIAMRPDKQLAGLLGLTDASATLADAYLLVNTASPPGAGIVNQTMQFHGTADRYTANGAASLATLYSSASAPTNPANPALTLRSVGSNGGQAAAFTYDLARSIVYTRQGNPAWAGQERDGAAPIRPDDLFFGAASGDPQPDWVDLNKVAIPQADEQQRLLANLIGHMNLARKPLPRFWYFPKGYKAVVLMTSDDHGASATASRFESYKASSPQGCSVADWECIRSTSYIYPGNGLSDAQAAAYTADGFEVGLHVDTQCSDWTPETLASFFAGQLAEFRAQYPSIGAPSSERTHCIVWSDWASHAKVELTYGSRLDTNYYYWPPDWVGDRPGLFTGSGMPMRFADLDGAMIDVYQATTQMTDESAQTYPYTIDTLLDRALGSEGYYGVFTANMHADDPYSPGAESIIASAKANGVPVVSGRQLLNWLDWRNSSAFANIAWSSNTLTFDITSPFGTRAGWLRAMVPAQNSVGGTVSGITIGGSPVAHTVQTIKGIEYAIFDARAGAVVARYQDATHPVAVNDSYTTAEDTPLTIGAPGVLGNDTDVDGDTLTAVRVTSPAHGTLTLNANGSFTYTPVANYNGPDSFTYKANDGTADSNVATVSITVTPVNDLPVAANDSYTTAEDTTLTIGAPGVLGNDTDVDGNTLTAVRVTSPSHGTLTLNANGSFTYTPAANYNGPDSFTYKANDGTADSNVATVSITVSDPGNDPPVAANDSYTTAEDAPLTIGAPGVLSNDTDVDGDTLTAVLATSPSHGTLALNANGSFTYTPAPNYNGPDSFTYKANDGTADSNVATVSITVTPVNDPPVAANDSYTTAEDAPLTIGAPGVLSNDTDVDGDTLTAVLDTSPSHGTLALNANGSFTYTPAPNYNGPDSFTYKANDGTADSNVATVSLTVSDPGNAPPVANAGPDQSVKTNATIMLDGSGSDPDGDLPLTYLWTQTGGPTVKLSDPTAAKPTFSAPGSPTMLTFTLTVTDSKGLPSAADEVAITVSYRTLFFPLVGRQK